jgi:hypothetical protein
LDPQGDIVGPKLAHVSGSGWTFKEKKKLKKKKKRKRKKKIVRKDHI